MGEQSASPDIYAGADSPRTNGSTYGTPTAEDSRAKSNENDAQLVVGAGRSLKTMLVDLMGVLEGQADSKVFIQGEFSLRIDGKEAYTIKLVNEDNVEPTNLKIKIDNAPASAVNGAALGMVSKRKVDDDMEEVEEPGSRSPSKRARTGSDPTALAAAAVAATEADNPDAMDITAQGEKEDEEDQPDFQRIMTKFHNVSAQIKWVEECRRIAGELHDKREDKWRSSSATFHDETRKARERHENFMISEMGWQRNMLIQLANDIKGLLPLMHSLKWEVPPQMQSHPPPPPTMNPPRQPPHMSSYRAHSDDKPLGKAYVPKPKKPKPVPQPTPVLAPSPTQATPKT